MFCGILVACLLETLVHRSRLYAPPLPYTAPMPTVVAVCTCQKHVTNVSKHTSMSKADGAMRFSLSCQEVMNYSESAKT